MGGHVVVSVNKLPCGAVKDSEPAPQATECVSSGMNPELVGSSSSIVAEDGKAVVVVDSGEADEEAPLIGMGECRICQEEDSITNLESPCGCSGSLKYAHRKCVQHWCNEKGDITCEICHQPYESGYTAPPRPPADETAIDIGGVWQISGAPLDMHDPRLLAIAEAERHMFEADYDDFNGANNSGAALCRSTALILMALLLLRHAMSITGEGDGNTEDDAATFFSLFLLRVVGFLLPCYIMIWAQPHSNMRPPGPIPIKDYAIETPFQRLSSSLEGEVFYEVKIDIDTSSSIAAINFVLKDEENRKWYHHRGRDFKVPLIDYPCDAGYVVKVRKGLDKWSGTFGKISNILIKPETIDSKGDDSWKSNFTVQRKQKCCVHRH